MRSAFTEGLTAHEPGSTLPLDEEGRLKSLFVTFALVLTSSLQRSQETCQLAGLGERAEIDRDLMERNYGEYEWLTPKQNPCAGAQVDDFQRRLPWWRKP